MCNRVQCLTSVNEPFEKCIKFVVLSTLAPDERESAVRSQKESTNIMVTQTSRMTRQVRTKETKLLAKTIDECQIEGT
jgi:hypothetical protein